MPKLWWPVPFGSAACDILSAAQRASTKLTKLTKLSKRRQPPPRQLLRWARACMRVWMRATRYRCCDSRVAQPWLCSRGMVRMPSLARTRSRRRGPLAASR